MQVLTWCVDIQVDGGFFSVVGNPNDIRMLFGYLTTLGDDHLDFITISWIDGTEVKGWSKERGYWNVS
jgi:hypothetical protein